MRMRDVSNSKELKVFVKGSFVLIGLIFILSYGLAALLLNFDRNIETINNHKISKNIENEKEIETYKKVDIDKKVRIGKNFGWKVFKLILVLVCFPILVFLLVFTGFYYLVKSYYENLYGASNNEGFIIKMYKLEMVKLEMQKQDQQKNDNQKFKNSLEMLKQDIQELEKQNHDSNKFLDEFLEKLRRIINLFKEWKDNNNEK